MICILMALCSCYGGVHGQHICTGPYIVCYHVPVVVCMLHNNPQLSMNYWMQIVFAAAKEGKKSLHIHAYKLIYKLLAYISAHKDMFKKHLTVSASSICSLRFICLKIFILINVLSFILYVQKGHAAKLSIVPMGYCVYHSRIKYSPSLGDFPGHLPQYPNNLHLLEIVSPCATKSLL